MCFAARAKGQAAIPVLKRCKCHGYTAVNPRRSQCQCVGMCCVHKTKEKAVLGDKAKLVHFC